LSPFKILSLFGNTSSVTANEKERKPEATNLGQRLNEAYILKKK
jgi:hypothetical protein